MFILRCLLSTSQSWKDLHHRPSHRQKRKSLVFCWQPELTRRLGLQEYALGQGNNMGTTVQGAYLIFV